MTKHLYQSKQQGVALIVSLFILLILTVLGTTSMRTTVLQERMVGNERNRAIAIQAAESALRDAETDIANNLLYRDGFNLPWQKEHPTEEGDPFDIAEWTDTESIVATSVIIATGAPARLKMARLNTDHSSDGSLNVEGYDGNAVSAGITNIRVTGRGLGGDANAEVIIQTHVGARLR